MMVNGLKSILALAVSLPVSITSVKTDFDLLIISNNRNFDPLLFNYFYFVSPEMLWFLYVPNIAEMVVPACFEVAHQHPGKLILSLSVKRDDLCSNLEMRNRIVVAARDFSAQRVNPQKTTLCVFHYFVLFRFCSLLVGETCAFVAH